ncbi:MAG: hypothetical protein LLF76_10165 [Planctomycetaceae bacterium]|nr:hypothetical protein [Planctomycetaceae bacterium]
MRNRTIWAAFLFLSFLQFNASALEDDLGTVGLWQMESIYYDTQDLPYTADDDAQHAGRDHDLLLWRSALNETPPTVVAGYAGNALLFEGGQFANCPDFWSSSYNEVKLDCMMYFTAMPTDLGADTTYLCLSSAFELYLWPGGTQPDALIFKVYYDAKNKITVQVRIGTLKNRWLHIVGTYDVNRNVILTVTDTTTGDVLSASAVGTLPMRAVNSDITFGSTSPSLGQKGAERNFRGMIDDVKVSNCIDVAHHAYNPVPADGETVYDSPAALQWSKGLVAQMSDLYFGTNAQSVTNALKYAGDIDGSTQVDLQDFSYAAAAWQNEPIEPYCADTDCSGQVDAADLNAMAQDWLAAEVPYYLGGTTTNHMEVPLLQPSTTYYWRTASANCSEVNAGNLWQFTTGGLKAFALSPSNGQSGAATEANKAVLHWGPGYRAESYDIYFGTSANPAFYAHTATETIASPLLTPQTVYYWRVDSIGPGGTIAGDVWQFTTGAVGAVSPSPANGSTDNKYPLGGVQLSWKSVFAPSSYRVYFGTQNPPAYLADTDTPGLMSPAVTSNTLYFWRVDCISEFGTVTGPVWQFRTSTPAFPTAEGFGRFTKGGRGGSVYHVTNLNNSGAGSLPDAVSQSDRTIVFDVGGQIVLSKRLSITKNRLTIAGQTAPGDGISIAGPGISIEADDIIMRYVRVRYTSSGTPDDALSLNELCDNVILDHVSVSWGTDEVLSINRSRNVTVQWCIVSEGLNCLLHSKGSLLEGPILTWHHNLYAHNNDRNPKNKGTFDYRNNVAYDWGFAPYIAGGNTGGQCFANCIGNYYIAGPSTTTEDGVMVIGGNSNYHLYFDDNRIDSNRNGTADGADLGLAMLRASEMPDVVEQPYVYPPVAMDTPQAAYTRVLADAGCSLVRDAIDTRVINEVVTQTGGIVYDYPDVGGLGTINGGTAPADTDLDGMPDSWETAHGLSIGDASDRNGDPDGDGYTNLEDYLNSLVP